MGLKRFLGSIISATPPTVSDTGYQDSSASGRWSPQQILSYIANGVWPTAGNISPDQYVEGVFSTYLYTGTGSAQTITNGIDLAGEGGLVWIKNRDTVDDNVMFSPTFGPSKMQRITTAAQETVGTDVFQSFNSDGFTHGGWSGVGGNGNDIASWSFRKKAGFFDVKTFTAELDQFVTVNHDLGCNIGAVVYKETSGTGDWYFWHKSFSENDIIRLNTAAAKQTGQGYISSQTSSSATFYTDANTTSTYVAYFFGDGDDSNAQIFGDNADESIIKCGSFTGTASGEVTVNLGWEPQFIIYKLSNNASSSDDDNWRMHDVMRGWDVTNRQLLNPNTNAAESSLSNTGGYEIKPTATGFIHEGHAGSSGSDYIYIAIRRPMMTPESGTEVFNPDYAWDTNNDIYGYLGKPADLSFNGYLNGSSLNAVVRSRLLGGNRMSTNSTAAEVTDTSNYWDNELGFGWPFGGGSPSTDYITWNFKRATGFFDVVAYTGNGTSNTTQNHNLGVAPELLIIKDRDAAERWVVYSSALGASKALYLNENFAAITDSGQQWWGNPATSPTSTIFTLGNDGTNNSSGRDYIAYLFATVAGVSKVGSFTHTNGSDTNVDCGFTSGARFVLIKRTDATDGWQVYDTARGIVAGADPVLQLNSTAAEFSQDLMDPYSAGFTITGTKTSGTYIFLAIA